MKRIIYITISVLLVLGFGFYGLYRFSNPDWDYGYEVEDYNYLDEFLYHYDEDSLYLRGTLWMKFASYGSNNFHLYPLNSDLDIQLPLVKKEFVEVKVGELNGDSYPLFLSLEFRQEEKNIFDELLCSYIGGDFCKRDLKLNSWRVYENVFPFPEISEIEGVKIINTILDKNLDSYEFPEYYNGYVFDDLASRLYDDNWDVTLNDFDSEEFNDYIKTLEYLYLLPEDTVLYKDFIDEFCAYGKESNLFYRELYFVKDEAELITSVCMLDEGVVPVAENVDRDNVQSLALDLLRIIKEEDDLSDEVVNSLLFSQVDESCNKGVGFNPEVIYLMKYLLRE